MEELKILVDMVAHLPQTALWVLVGFWAYKVICVGSIYGVLRLAICKAHDTLVNPKRQDVDVRLLVNGHVITGTQDELMRQLERLKHSSYIHDRGIDFLRRALDDAFEKYPDQAPKSTWS